ncbi:MAG: NUDIX hydrolase [Patescibacteria group bacterium]
MEITQGVRPLAEEKGTNHLGQSRRQLVASAILFHEGRVLLIRRSPDEEPAPGSWGLPSGGVEFGESCKDAAARECFEETGILVRVQSVVEVEDYFYDKGDERTYVTECIFLVQAVGESVEVRLNREHDAFEFVDAECLGAFETLVEPRKRAIRKAQARIKS